MIWIDKQKRVGYDISTTKRKAENSHRHCDFFVPKI